MPFNNKGVWTFNGIPDFNNQLEADRYFDKEANFWIKGRYGLSGEYYKYLTMYQIRDRVSGWEGFPRYRQVDHEIIFPWIKETMDPRKPMDGLWFTQRGAGKSTIMSGYLPMETAISNPKATVIMTSESVDTTKTNFSEKLKVAYEGLHDNYRPSLSTDWPDEKKDKQFVKFAERKRGQKDKGLGSVIKSIETAHSPKSPNKLEGQGTRLLLVDELFKHPHLQEVLSRGGPLTKTFDRKVGSAIYFGSLSDATAKGQQTAEYLWNNAAALGINRLFVPATYYNPYIQLYDDDGRKLPGQYLDVRINGDEGRLDLKKAEEQILKNRLVFEKLKNPKLLAEQIMMYPLVVEELLEVSKQEWWSDSEMLEMRSQKSVVVNAIKENDFSKCDRPASLYINREYNDQLTFDYNITEKAARFFIFEEPVEGRKYGIGVDTIPFNTENKEGSDHVAAVKCFDTDQYVALYAERSSSAALVARSTINLQIMYNNAMALVEKNSIGALKVSYENFGVIKLLAPCPFRFRPKGWNGERGLNKDKNTPELRQLVRQYLFGNELDNGMLKYMNMRRFFDEYPLFPFENTDFMDAMAMAEALHEDYKFWTSKSSQQQEAPQVNIIYRTNEKGQRVMVNSGARNVRNDGSLDVKHLFK
jgi:hypothetical protein